MNKVWLKPTAPCTTPLLVRLTVDPCRRWCESLLCNQFHICDKTRSGFIESLQCNSVSYQSQNRIWLRDQVLLFFKVKTGCSCLAVLNMTRFPDRHPTGFCNSEPDRTGFRKKLNRIRYGYPNCIDHCSKMLYQSFLRI